MGIVQSVVLKKIMILEDESALAELAIMSLGQWQIESTTFKNPEMVSQILAHDHVCGPFCEEFDGIVTDLEMGTKMNGDQFLIKLFNSRCILRTKPVVMVTANSDRRLLQDFCRRIGVAFVSKPYQMTALYNGLIENYREILAGNRKIR